MQITFISQEELSAFADFCRTCAPSDRLTYRRQLLNTLIPHPAAAAVLVGFTRTQKEDYTIILTVRTDFLAQHPGQIAFPGGRQEPGENPIHAAIRETQEEVGIDGTKIQILTSLPAILVPSGFTVVPVLASLELDRTDIKHNPAEVSVVFSLPAAIALNPDCYQLTAGEWGNIPFNEVSLIYQEHRIWGLTAEILYFLAGQFAVFKQRSPKL